MKVTKNYFKISVTSRIEGLQRCKYAIMALPRKRKKKKSNSKDDFEERLIGLKTLVRRCAGDSSVKIERFLNDTIFESEKDFLKRLEEHLKEYKHGLKEKSIYQCVKQQVKNI